MASVLIFVIVAGLRFLMTVGFNNDHFVHLSAAQQLLFGDWPTRDFVDIGRPLTIAASAIFQEVIGRNLFAEALLVSGAFGLAASLTAFTVGRVLRSWPLGVTAAVIEFVALPRSFSYPKILTGALGIWLIWRFIQNPSPLRRFHLAIMIAVAFLFRHDLGLYVAAGCVTAQLVVDAARPLMARVRDSASLVLTSGLLIAPYLAYVQYYGGMANYLATTLAANRYESGYVWPNPLTWHERPDALLVYVFHALPIFTLWIFGARKMATDSTGRFAISVAVLAIATNFGLMWDPLYVRIPDAVTPAAVLIALMASRLSVGRQPALKVLTAAAIAAVFFLLADMANASEEVARTGLSARSLGDPRLLAGKFTERASELHERFESDAPSPYVTALVPFFGYLDRCTAETDRLFLGGLIPEVAYYARRPFGGGGYEHYNFASETNQRLTISRLMRQQVPFALIPGESASELMEHLPIVNDYIGSRYEHLARVPVFGGLSVEVMIDRTVRWPSIDAETGWPCRQ